ISHWWPGEHPTAIDVVGRAGAIATGVGGEEERHRGDVIRHADAARHDLRGRYRAERRVVVRAGIHARGRDHAGSDVVDRDAVRSELDRHRARQIAKSDFRDAIGAGPRPARLLVDRRYVDDPPANASLDHRLGRVAGTVEWAVEVRFHDAFELLKRLLVEPAVDAHAGVVDQHV